ncbi:unnamed protein product [Symbiodinium necroappetens]|uniref:Uncharacterized protein n=1 Tax=Symbiodinium necroappetens TaxID=1628268 RepID=A0A813C836_9DINO|nr:unnamed protein product [Symbiodinium necroappetens]
MADKAFENFLQSGHADILNSAWSEISHEQETFLDIDYTLVPHEGMDDVGAETRSKFLFDNFNLVLATLQGFTRAGRVLTVDQLAYCIGQKYGANFVIRETKKTRGARKKWLADLKAACGYELLAKKFVRPKKKQTHDGQVGDQPSPVEPDGSVKSGGSTNVPSPDEMETLPWAGHEEPSALEPPGEDAAADDAVREKLQPQQSHPAVILLRLHQLNLPDLPVLISQLSEKEKKKRSILLFRLARAMKIFTLVEQPVHHCTGGMEATQFTDQFAKDVLATWEARSFPEMFAAAGDPTYDADEQIRVLFASPIDWHEDADLLDIVNFMKTSGFHNPTYNCRGKATRAKDIATAIDAALLGKLGLTPEQEVGHDGRRHAFDRERHCRREFALSCANTGPCPRPGTRSTS